jgi:hypothetical protein
VLVFLKFQSEFGNQAIEELIFFGPLKIPKCKMTAHFSAHGMCWALGLVEEWSHALRQDRELADDTALVSHHLCVIWTLLDCPGSGLQNAPIKRLLEIWIVLYSYLV